MPGFKLIHVGKKGPMWLAQMSEIKDDLLWAGFYRCRYRVDAIKVCAIMLIEHWNKLNMSYILKLHGQFSQKCSQYTSHHCCAGGRGYATSSANTVIYGLPWSLLCFMHRASYCTELCYNGTRLNMHVCLWYLIGKISSSKWEKSH